MPGDPIYLSKAVIKTNTRCVMDFTGSNPRDTGNLVVSLEIKVGARVMIPVNVDVSDGLFNGAMGTLVDVEMGADAQPKVMFVEFTIPKLVKWLNRRNL